MTRETMLAALEQIEKTPKGHVHGSRKGIVGAANQLGKGYIAFRLDGSHMTAEFWPSQYTSSLISSFPVPEDLRQRVRTMLDNL